MLGRLVGILIMLATITCYPALRAEEILDPDDAFMLSARLANERTIELTWRIAPGHYLYRDKLRFEGDAIEQPAVPRGIRLSDPYFGVVEIFRNTVKVYVSVAPERLRPGGLMIRVASQGCSETMGVCYPPIIRDLFTTTVR